MARMPGASWRPIPRNFTDGGQDSVHGVVVHIMAGTLVGSDSWFRNPAAQASAHFGTGKAGALYQWVDTADRAWAQANGNRTWLSVENEGKGGDSLTDAQLQRNAEVLAWAHKVYGVPLQVTHDVNGRGLGYHGMGGAAWGGHTSCPGSPIVAQLPEIVKRAKALAGVKPAPAPAPSPAGSYTVKDGDTLSSIGKALGIKWETLADLNGLKAPYVIRKGQKLKTTKAAPKPGPAHAPFPGVAFFKLGKRHPLFTAMGKRLVAVGCGRYKVGPGPELGEADVESYEAFQRKLGYTGAAAKWPPGPASWAKLRVPKV